MSLQESKSAFNKCTNSSYCIAVLGGHARDECRNSGLSALVEGLALSCLNKEVEPPTLMRSLSISHDSFDGLQRLGVFEEFQKGCETPSLNFVEDEKPVGSITPNFLKSSPKKEAPSPLELVIITEKSEEECQQIIDEIKEYIRADSDFYPVLTVASLDQTESRLHFTNPHGRSKCAPQRDIDLAFAYGDREVMLQYKKQTYSAIQKLVNTQTKNWKRDFLDKESADLFNLLEGDLLPTSPAKAIDLENGVLHYDNMGFKSTKHPFLRVVQHYIVLSIIKAIQSRRISEEQFLEMPRKTGERIQWLSKNHFWDLDSASATSLESNYNAALSFYFESQRRYEESEAIEMTVASEKLRSIGSAIYDITKDDSCMPSKITEREALKQERSQTWGLPGSGKRKDKQKRYSNSLNK